MSKRIDVDEAEFLGLVKDVLRRLARDPAARHLWQWQPRPDCADEPPGPARRNHLRTLLGLVGAAALPAVAAGCSALRLAPKDAGPVDGPAGKQDGATRDGATRDGANGEGLPEQDVSSCGDDPCAVDLGADTSPVKDLAPSQDLAPKDDAVPTKDLAPNKDLFSRKDIKICGDDPCACADDPCGCADDPCACADDPCVP